MTYAGANQLMIHCRDCQFWLLWTKDRKGPLQYLGSDTPYDHLCTRTMTNGNIPDDEHSLAHAVETDMGIAGIATSPEFGCVQGEARRPVEDLAK